MSKPIPWLAFFCVLIVSVARAQLAAEVPILVGGEPLDVGHLGNATPAVIDYDGDGNKDLLVGHGFRVGATRSRPTQHYRNVGANAAPRFELLRNEPNASPSGYLTIPGSYGAPQLVDMDGDGLRDWVIADWPFELRLLRGQRDGKFAASEIVLERGQMRVNYVQVGLHVVDWEGDGDFDLVMGGAMQETRLGHVCLLRNVGTSKEFRFAAPEPILADGLPIQAPENNPVPAVADWNADGRPDLILGCGDGSVLWFPNTGSRAAPVFGAEETLVPPPAGLTDRGKQASPWVVDWNEDGRLDLVVGDYGRQFEKGMSSEESQSQREARAKQAEAFTEWARAFTTYRELTVRSKASAENALLFKSEMADLRGKMVELNAKRDAQFQREQMLQPGRQYHGRVWLFLRKAE